MTLFCLDLLKDVVPNHLLSTDMFQAEYVARGYLAGSGWKEYRQSGAVCGIPLPAGLRESDQLPQPIFTPATKAQTSRIRPGP
jgi:phosphoribosylaminoimidazole-succinocarboxamide synthase